MCTHGVAFSTVSSGVGIGSGDLIKSKSVELESHRIVECVG
jgi:hypothetical protein